MKNRDTKNRHLEEIIKYLGKYLPPVNDISKKKARKEPLYAQVLNNQENEVCDATE